MKRGPKPRTPKNGPQHPANGPALWNLTPVSALSPVAQAEFQRLAIALDRQGMLERVDVAVLTECARIKARLDQAYQDDDTKVINQLTVQRRGLLRELGVTLQPSRSVVKTIAKSGSEPGSRWGGKLKVSGF